MTKKWRLARRTSSIRAEDLNAFLDGALAPGRAAEIERAIQRDPTLQAQLSHYRHQTKKLHALFDPVLHAPLPDRLLELARQFGKKNK